MISVVYWFLMKKFLLVFFLINFFSSLAGLFCKKILFFWVILELKFYSTLPLLVVFNRSKVSNLFFFVMKVLSSFFIVFGLIGGLKVCYISLAIMLKLGIFFPVFWNPLMVCWSDWCILPVFLVNKKMPSLILLTTLGLTQKNTMKFFIGVSFLVSSILLLNSGSKLKLFLSISSISQTCLLVFMCGKMPLMFVYFFFYGLTLILLVLFQIWGLFTSVPMVYSLLFFFQSGFPPSVIFFMKLCLVDFFSSFSLVLFIVVVILYIKFLGYLSLFFCLWGGNTQSNSIFLSLDFFCVFLLLMALATGLFLV